MKKSLIHSMLLGAALVIGQNAVRAADQPMAPGTTGGRMDAMRVTVAATVTGLDLTNREVTLKGPRGNEITVEVDERVKRLDEVKVGDLVKMDYFVAVAAELREPTADEEKNPIQAVAGGGKAPAGTLPAAGVLRAFKVVADVVDTDAAMQTVTLKGPRGNTVTVRVADPARFAKVKKGDHLVVTYAEALAVSLVKADQQMEK